MVFIKGGAHRERSVCLCALLCVMLCAAKDAVAAKVHNAHEAIAIVKRLCAQNRGTDPFPYPPGPWTAKLRHGKWIVRQTTRGKSPHCDWAGATVKADTGATDPLCIVCIAAH